MYVFLAPFEKYGARLASFKQWLLVPTLLYFVAATIWQVVRMRQDDAVDAATVSD